jgi:peptide/nickel transport system substrate-binding protein
MPGSAVAAIKAAGLRCLPVKRDLAGDIAIKQRRRQTQGTDYGAAGAAGIEITAKPYDINALYARSGPLYRRSFQLALLGLETGLDPDPTSYLACAKRTPNGFNFATYCNASVDRALDQALATYDPKARRRLYGDVQRALVKDVPYLFLWQASEVDVIPKRLSGYEPSPAGGPYASVARWRLR